MNTKNNKKGIEYKEKLKKGFLQLLEANVDIDQITVKSLCEKAGVNRSTFYSHYSVPRDIMVEIENEALSNAATYMYKMNSRNFDYLSVFLEYIKEHDDVFRILFLHAKDKEFLENLMQVTLYSFESIKAYYKNRKDYTYVNAFITAGSKEVINTWILSNYRDDVEYIKNLLLKINEAAIKEFT